MKFLLITIVALMTVTLYGGRIGGARGGFYGRQGGDEGASEPEERGETTGATCQPAGFGLCDNCPKKNMAKNLFGTWCCQPNCRHEKAYFDTIGRKCCSKHLFSVNGRFFKAQCHHLTFFVGFYLCFFSVSM